MAHPTTRRIFLSRQLLAFWLMTTCTLCYGTEATLNDWFQTQKWQNRILLVFTPNLSHINFVDQKSEVGRHMAGFKERDLEVVFVQKDAELILSGPDINIASAAFRQRFEVEDQDFTVILLGKDSGIKYRSPDKLSAESLFRIIDAMPMRQAEMRVQRDANP